MIAISSHIQREIKKYYGRDSVVIFPPVDIERFQNIVSKKRHGFVITGRQTPYKRIDLAVAACSKLGLPLKVIGRGPEHEKLVKMAGPTITFDVEATDADVAQYIAEAEAFLFPGLDDFGIAPVEAMAAGTPVIAYKAGGALDYVVEGKTGLFFDEQTVESLVKALEKFTTQKFNTVSIKTHTRQFSSDNFDKQLSVCLYVNL